MTRFVGFLGGVNVGGVTRNLHTGKEVLRSVNSAR